MPFDKHFWILVTSDGWIFYLFACSIHFCRNIGFGFVRGVDTEKRIFYVVTPIGLEEMQLVNCLSMGAVTLPTGVIGNQIKQYNQEQSRKVSL